MSGRASTTTYVSAAANAMATAASPSRAVLIRRPGPGTPAEEAVIGSGELDLDRGLRGGQLHGVADRVGAGVERPLQGGVAQLVVVGEPVRHGERLVGVGRRDDRLHEAARETPLDGGEDV